MNNKFLGKMAIKKIRKFDLFNGDHIEIAWHHGRKRLCAEFHHYPNWGQAFANDRKELMRLVRLGLTVITDIAAKRALVRLGVIDVEGLEIHYGQEWK